MNATHVVFFNSVIGEIALSFYVKNATCVLRRVCLPREYKGRVSRTAMSMLLVVSAEDPLVCDVVTCVKKLCAGEYSNATSFLLDMGEVSEFQRRVYTAEQEIPRGRVMSYQCIAEIVGSPRAARAVGTAQRKNPFPLIIPCHRVVPVSGGVGKFQGGARLKAALLSHEGVSIEPQGKRFLIGEECYADC